MLCLEYNLTSCRHHETHRIILFLICTPGEEGFLLGDEWSIVGCNALKGEHSEWSQDLSLDFLYKYDQK